MVREALRTRGVVEARDVAPCGSSLYDAVLSGLKREVEMGAAIRVFRGVFARPDVAAAIHAAIAATTRGAK